MQKWISLNLFYTSGRSTIATTILPDLKSALQVHKLRNLFYDRMIINPALLIQNSWVDATQHDPQFPAIIYCRRRFTETRHLLTGPIRTLPSTVEVYGRVHFLIQVVNYGSDETTAQRHRTVTIRRYPPILAHSSDRLRGLLLPCIAGRGSLAVRRWSVWRQHA